MKTLLYFLLVTFLLMNSLLSQAFLANGAPEQSTEAHDAWLKEQFSEKHEQLIPLVAVADMFYACNKQRKSDPIGYQLADLVTKMHKNQLADKLILCLGEDSIKSDVALNFGLKGCFHQQLAHLPEAERQQKMALVEKAILSLSRSERQKSFTQCVTEQAIHYLQ